MRRTRHMLLVLASLAATACHPATSSSGVESLAAVKGSQHNVAMVVTGTTERGRQENLDRMQTLLSDRRLNFDVRTDYGTAKDQLLSDLATAGSDAGDDGTVILYFN